MKKKTFFTVGTVVSLIGGLCISQNQKISIDDYKVKIKNLPETFSGKKILHLSDLHKKKFGEDYNELVSLCKRTNPDYIFLTGDLYSRDEIDLTGKVVLLKKLSDIAPVYYIPGNHETGDINRTIHLVEEVGSADIKLLINQSERIYEGNDHINVYGLVLPDDYYKWKPCCIHDEKKSHVDVLYKLLGKPEEKAVNILLAHNPLLFETYSEWKSDLVFSGHVHGGVVRLPVVGGVLSPERRFFPKYSKGLYKCGESKMMVSAGLGKFRMFNPSQIVVVTLEKG